MSHNVTAEHVRIAEEFVKAAHARGGLAELDLERFWTDQAAAIADPFGRDIAQVAFGAGVTGECVYEELGIRQDFHRYDHDPAWRAEINKTYNDRAEAIVGRRILDETPPDPSVPRVPEVKQLFELFEMENVWDPVSQSWWLKEAAHDEDELCSLLDRVDARLERPRDFFLPPGWEAGKAALLRAGRELPLYRWQRGPVTFATSLLGPEALIFLIVDNPALAGRLRDTMLRAMLAKLDLQNAEAGFTRATAPKGFGFADDNCCLLTAGMYESFALPIVRGVWEVTSPGPKDSRFQHSDSDMGHIVPLLARCRMTGVNFGPKVMVDTIRHHMPEAVIYGELAPFTYSRNEEVNMVAEFLRDHAMTRESRGLVFATAGSVNNGTRLSSMRLLMAAVQKFGRFDR